LESRRPAKSTPKPFPLKRFRPKQLSVKTITYISSANANTSLRHHPKDNFHSAGALKHVPQSIPRLFLLKKKHAGADMQVFINIPRIVVLRTANEGNSG
jgi:hypothetical protein